MSKSIVHYKRVKRPAKEGDYVKVETSNKFLRPRKYYKVSKGELCWNDSYLVLRKRTEYVVSLYNAGRNDSNIKVYERIVK